MLLYVMRHGPAEDRAATGRDVDRALTRDGREVVRRAALEARKARGARKGALRVLSSPARRARETAETVIGVLSPHARERAEIELHDDLTVDAGLPLNLVDTLAADTLLVGHQPAVEELARTLLHPARVPLPAGFRTATILALERGGGPGGPLAGGAPWGFAWVVDPHQLAG